VDILLPNNVAIPNVHVTEALNLGEYDILIGMDIITIGDFSITNANKMTVFSFRIPPYYKHTDYVKEAGKIQTKKKRRKLKKKIDKIK